MNDHQTASSRAGTYRRLCAGAALLLGMSGLVFAADLADQPIFSSANVPGNLALALSVEWPTASRTAHVGNYAPATKYLGYFDPDKCYTYEANTGSNGVSGTDKGDLGKFNPTGEAGAANHDCTGANSAMWSGNFLNWASTATIDPFRWAMTGGRRVVDSATETVLEKGWHSGQGLFDDRDLTTSAIAGATPFDSATRVQVQIGGRGFKMRLNVTGASSARTFTAKYYNNVNLTGAAVTVNNDNANHTWGSSSPAAGVNADNFSAELVGTFRAPEAGNYVFRTVSDDGVRLWVDTSGRSDFRDGNLVIQNWTAHGATNDDSATIALTKDQEFSVRIRFFDSGGDAVLRLLWRKPSTSDFVDFSTDTATYDYTMRVKVCDPTAPGGVEPNCKRYGSNYKPEGLIQKYADKMRFSAFGYLNDSSDQRDGGVLRANQKFVGPTQPVPGSQAITNTLAEWSSVDGTMSRNPNPADATATTTATGITISDSGVMNYLNKFGQLIPGNYKNYDPVSEMYYAVLRYYRNLGNVTAWSNLGTDDVNTKKAYLDGFPVVTNWQDPILYSCQRNFVLGIGDIYTHVDKNVAGNATYRTREPSMPPEIAADNTVNAVTATNKVGALQGLGDLGSSNDYSGRNNSAYIAGLAYDANSTDIRSDKADKQTVQTYWVDVLEQPFQANNQFYLAAKFGGLKVPKDFDPYTFAGTIPLDWWSTSGETLTDTRGNGTTQPRPDNYFAAGRPDTMVAGLTKAFESIANAIKAYTTSFSLSTVQLTQSGNASYASQYDAKDWSGIVAARELSFTSDGTPSTIERWNSTSKLAAQLAGSGWNTGRRIATWNGSRGVPFRIATGGITQAQQEALAASVGGNAQNFLNYMRGDRSNEVTNDGGVYRARSSLLGDVVNSKVTAVGPPAQTYGESSNPGYAAFKTAKANRPVMVYVGANDGMLHAFNGTLNSVDATTGAATDAGKEVFAYVPSATFQGPSNTPAVSGLAQLGSPNYVHHNYVDSTALAFDVDFGRAGGATTTQSDGTGADWRTVLIGGLGKGGKSYYAIDVSDPAALTSESALADKVLWEFTDSTMGYSYGTPVVVKTKKFGWVVVLTSGYTDGTDGEGFIYLVDPRNGSLLEKIGTGVAAPGLAYASAFGSGTTYLADSIYVGDLNGVLWRFDLTAQTGTYPVATKLAAVTDGATPAKAQPITTAPQIQVSPTTRQRYVMFGTGKLLAPTDVGSTAPQSFYAILDGTANAFSAVSTPITRANLTALTDPTLGVALGTGSKGWYIDLGTTNNVAWRVVSPAAAGNGSIAFSSLLTSAEACSPSGKSRVYFLNFTTGKTELDPAAAFVNYAFAVTDLVFVQGGTSGGTTGLGGSNDSSGIVGGDNGNLEVFGKKKAGSSTLRMLNWRELPTIE